MINVRVKQIDTALGIIAKDNSIIVNTDIETFVNKFMEIFSYTDIKVKYQNTDSTILTMTNDNIYQTYIYVYNLDSDICMIDDAIVSIGNIVGYME